MSDRGPATCWNRWCVSSNRRGRVERQATEREWWLSSIRIEDNDVPKDAEVLHPLSALDQRTKRDRVASRRRRRSHSKLEPGDLPGADIRRRLDGESIEAWPSRRRRPVRPVSAQEAWLILSRLRSRGPKVGDLAETTAHPAPRSAVVVRDRRDRGITLAQGHVSGLPVPRGVKATLTRGDGGGRSDPGSDRAHAGRCRRGSSKK